MPESAGASADAVASSSILPRHATEYHRCTLRTAPMLGRAAWSPPCSLPRNASYDESGFRAVCWIDRIEVMTDHQLLQSRLRRLLPYRSEQLHLHLHLCSEACLIRRGFRQEPPMSYRHRCGRHYQLCVLYPIASRPYFQGRRPQIHHPWRKYYQGHRSSRNSLRHRTQLAVDHQHCLRAAVYHPLSRRRRHHHEICSESHLGPHMR